MDSKTIEKNIQCQDNTSQQVFPASQIKKCIDRLTSMKIPFPDYDSDHSTHSQTLKKHGIENGDHLVAIYWLMLKDEQDFAERLIDITGDDEWAIEVAENMQRAFK